MGASPPSDTERLLSVIAVQSEIAAASLGVDDVMTLVVARAQELTGATSAMLEIAERDEMVYRAVSGRAAAHLGLRLKIGASLSGLCVREQSIKSCSDTETDDRVDRAACRRIDARSLVLVPLRHQQRVVGVLKVAWSRPAAFSATDVAILELLATVIAAALDRAASSDALRASEQRFRALADTAHDVILTGDADGRVTFWNRAAERVFGWSSFEMAGRRFEELLPEPSRPAHREWLAIVHAEGDTQRLSRVGEMRVLRRDGSELTLEASLSHWRVGDVSSFTIVARDISERKNAEARLVARANYDALTGLLTRAAGEDRMAIDMAHAERYGVMIAFVMIDVDHFKKVNDGHGHAMGDRVLRTLGALVKRTLRATDIAIRWGGEEVLLVLPHTPIDGARRCAERIRADLEAMPHDGLRVTLSGGVAVREGKETAAAVIARADVLLYEAKAAGRNRVY